MKPYIPLRRMGLILALVTVVGLGLGRADTQIDTPYPEGYRYWTHVRSTVVTSESQQFAKFGGLHVVYANPKAIEGFRTGTFADGSTFAEDFFDVATPQPGFMIPGAKKMTAVMHRDAAKFKDTGGWGFDVYDPDKTSGKVGSAAKTECFLACHAMAKGSQFVFTPFKP